VQNARQTTATTTNFDCGENEPKKNGRAIREKKTKNKYKKKSESDVNGSRIQQQETQKIILYKNQQNVSNSRTLANWKLEIKTNDYCLFKIMINNCEREGEREREREFGANGTAVWLLRRNQKSAELFSKQQHSYAALYQMGDDENHLFVYLFAFSLCGF